MSARATDSAPAVAAGPAFAGRVVVATADDNADDASAPPASGGGGGVASGASAPAAPAGLEDTCLDGSDAACKRWAMDGYYRAVAQEKAGKLGRPVRVSWYGDW